jgi:hypothetical protein
LRPQKKNRRSTGCSKFRVLGWGQLGRTLALQYRWNEEKEIFFLEKNSGFSEVSGNWKTGEGTHVQRPINGLPWCENFCRTGI